MDTLSKHRLVEARKVGIPDEELKAYERHRQRGVASLKANRPVEGYAQLWRTYYEVDIETAGLKIAESVKRDGKDSVRQQLLDEIDELTAKSKQSNNETAGINLGNVEQCSRV